MYRLITLLMIASFAAGCATDYVAKPESIVAEDVAQYEITGPVAVTGMQQSRYKMLHPIGQLHVDYRDVSGAAATLLSEELQGRIGTVNPESPKTLHIHVSDMILIRSFECLINFVVETGDGYQRGYEAYGKSWNYQEVCNKAFPDIAVLVLGDPAIQLYLQN